MGLKMWPMSGPVHLLERSVAMYASYCIESRRVCLILHNHLHFAILLVQKKNSKRFQIFNADHEICEPLE